MAKRPANWWSRTAERIELSMHGHWHTVLAFASIAAIGIGIGMWHHGEDGDFVEEQAEVLKLRAAFDGEKNRAHLSVRLRDGSVRELAAGGDELRRCRPGSSVYVLRGSSSIRVSPRGCAP